MVKTTVRFSEELLKEMDLFCKDNGFPTRNAMLITAFQTLKLVYANQGSQVNLQEQLINIQKRLDEIVFENTLIEKEEQEDLIKLREMELPDYEIISKEIIELMKNFKGSMKEYLMMEVLERKYSKATLWATLMRMRDLKKIKLENGEWRIVK